MIETPENVNFSLKHLQTWSAELLDVKNFDGYLLRVFEGNSLVYFATVAWTDLFFKIDSIMAYNVWVIIKWIGYRIGDHGCDRAIGSQTLFRFGLRGKSILLGLGKIIRGEIALTHLIFIIKKHRFYCEINSFTSSLHKMLFWILRKLIILIVDRMRIKIHKGLV